MRRRFAPSWPVLSGSMAARDWSVSTWCYGRTVLSTLRVDGTPSPRPFTTATRATPTQRLSSKSTDGSASDAGGTLWNVGITNSSSPLAGCPLLRGYLGGYEHDSSERDSIRA